MTNRILQIYHDEDQLSKLIYEPIHNPIRNDKYYLCLESDVIRRCILSGMHRGYDYFGLLAPGFQEKIAHWKSVLGPKWTRNWQDFSPERLEQVLSITGAPVVSLAMTPPHQVVQLGQRFHPNFKKIFARLFLLMGVSMVKTECEYPVYFNYFLATERFWDSFIVFLNTAIELLVQDEYLNALCMADATYIKPFPKDLAETFGINHWPHHPFICERLVSIFIEINGLKVHYY